MNSFIHDIASQWQIKLAAGPLSNAADAELEQWLAHDPLHRLALAEAGIAWHGTVLAHPDAGVVTRPPASRSRTWPAWLAGAAAAPALVFLLAMLPGWWTMLRADQYTGIGEVRVVALDDGSAVTLDSDSAISVDYSSKAREIRVLRGAAWFEVQADPARPFRVHADGVDATALGTAYAVDVRDAAVVVAVDHGVVAVTRSNGASLATLHAGQYIQVAGADPAPRTSNEKTSAAYAFRNRLLAFDVEPLESALARLDRYLPQRVVLLDQSKAALQVTAVFPVSDAALALDALARSHGLRVRHWPGLLLLDAVPAS